MRCFTWLQLHRISTLNTGCHSSWVLAVCSRKLSARAAPSQSILPGSSLLVAMVRGSWAQPCPGAAVGCQPQWAALAKPGRGHTGWAGLGWRAQHLLHAGCFTDWAMLGHTERIGLPEHDRFVLSMFFMFIPTPETWDCHKTCVDPGWICLDFFFFFFLVKSSKYWDQRKSKTIWKCLSLRAEVLPF